MRTLVNSDRRIMIVNHTFSSTDGQGEVNRRIAEALLAAGQKVVLIGNNVPTELAEHPQVEHYTVPLPSGLPTSLSHQFFARRTFELIKKHRRPTDCLILNGAMTFANSDLNICHFVHSAWARSPGHDWHQRKSLRNCYQRLVTSFNARWEKRVYHQADRIVAVSEKVRRDLIDFAGVDDARINVIPNGIDLSRIEAANINEATRTSGEFRIGFCGDLKTRRKNFDLLLEALPKLDSRFVVHAAGNYVGGPYVNRVSELGLQSRVKFLGSIGDVARFYSDCDIFVCVSHYEPWGLVVPEAMLASLPVVVSRNVGAASIIESGVNGCIISSSYALDELLETLRQLESDSSLRQRLGQAARLTASELRWQNVGNSYVDLISQISDSAHHAN